MEIPDPPPTAGSPSPVTGATDNPARALARGVSRMLGEAGHSCLYEFTLRNGRRADVIAVAQDGLFTIVEVKTTLADFRADQKWQDYLHFCDFFYFAVPESFPAAVIPASCGLIVADAYDAVVRRPSPEDRMNPTRRRALTLRYAQTAGRRLTQLLDPGIGV